MADEIGLFEAMYTQRALRYIAPDPLPDALVRKVLDAGIRARPATTPPPTTSPPTCTRCLC